tara:strand:- start:113 stop:382 length:270 start_codon:yes stop_codon:yes gene_type:complete
MSPLEEAVKGSVWEGSNGEKAYRLSKKIGLLALIIAILYIFLVPGSGRMGSLMEVPMQGLTIFLIGLGISFLLLVYSSFCYIVYEKSNK